MCMVEFSVRKLCNSKAGIFPLSATEESSGQWTLGFLKLFIAVMKQGPYGQTFVDTWLSYSYALGPSLHLHSFYKGFLLDYGVWLWEFAHSVTLRHWCWAKKKHSSLS